MEFDAQTITIILSALGVIVSLVGATCAIIGVVSKMLTNLEARHNRQRAEDIARQEAQRQEDREELREIKDQIYNHLPTQIKAVEDGLRTEMRETEKRIIDRINELFAAYLSKDKDEKTDKEEQDANAADERL